MRWALAINDPQAWMGGRSDLFAEALSLIEQNDGSFKHYLDRYKYAERFPEHPVTYYREQAETFLFALNARLSKQTHLMGNHLSLPDVAIFPFVRQFAHVDRDWFYDSHYHYLKSWLEDFLQSAMFISAMRK